MLIKGKEVATGKELAEQKNLREPHQALAMRLNGTLVDLSHPLKEGDEVAFLDFEEKAGKEVFWHSSAHVLAQAVLRLWPEALPTIGPPIDNGFYYDFANLKISESDFPKIEAEVKKILKENYKPERVVFKNAQEALQAFHANHFKCELIREFDPKSPITGYRQGEFFDLCRGPHLPSLGKIKAFKILKTSGAYWRGSSDNEMLTRIYAISFPDNAQLKEYLHILEEAKKRDHHVLGNRLGLYAFQPEAPGMPFILPRGMILWNALIDEWRALHLRSGYVEIKTPQLMSKELWIRSGHWDHYRDNMFFLKSEEREFAIKPMNCPGCMLYYASQTHSYRDFPLRIAELGHVHRFEPSGALHGLFRARGFHQDDAHIFMQPHQIQEEILAIFRLVEHLYSLFGLHYKMELSTRPKNSIGTDAEWKAATEGLKGALDEWGKPYTINEGDGAFYGPKIDLHILDALGRSWQCGTIQLDMALPQRFDLVYKDSDGVEKRPVMLHRAIFGSIERFFGILVEHFAGRFPLWMSPEPVRILTVAEKHREHAYKTARQIREHGFICEVDDANASIGKKVRAAQLDQVNYMITIGDKELEHGTLAIRSRAGVLHEGVALEKFLEQIEKERATRALEG